MSSGPRPMCVECIHADEELRKCTAFPDGIPDEILLSEQDHRVPIDGDSGIQFEPTRDSELTGDPSQAIPWLVVQPEQGGDR